MSQIEDRVDAILDDKKETKLRTPWRFRTIIIVLLLAAAAVLGSVRFFTPRQYTAKAWIQILTRKPHFVFDDAMLRNYDNLVETQFALMRSPLIIEKALENPAVSQLPIVKKQLNRPDWLTKKLKLQKQGRSEMITVSMTTPDPQASAMIVNSVIDAYFDYYENQSQDWNLRLVRQLTLELNRQQSAARLLQEEIRSGLESAAKKGGSSDSQQRLALNVEAMQKDIQQNEVKLQSLQAELTVLNETKNNVAKQISDAAVRREVDQDPAVKELVGKQLALNIQEKSLKEILKNENDPKILEIRQQIDENRKLLTATRNAMEEEKREEMIRNALEKQEKNIWAKSIEVRTAEVLIENLQRHYRNCLREAGDQTVQIVDISFQQEQLKRINSVLDLLMNRVVSLQTEMNAPSQIQLRRKAIVPNEPDKMGFFSFMGL